GRTGIAGVSSPRHVSTGIAQELKRACHLLSHCSNGGNGVPEGRPKGARKDGGAVLRPHSTGEGGEPQGSARGSHGTHWREGGNKHTHLSKGDITETQNSEPYVHRHRQNI